MKIAIVCDSITGNTMKLARCIYDECKEIDAFICKDYCDEVMDSDLIFIGSYTKNMEPSEKVKKIYRKITDKKLFIFGTCGYGCGEDYYRDILHNTASYIPGSNEVLDYFYCQGKMPYTSRLTDEARLRKDPGNNKILKMIENFDKALKHPDFSDLIDLQIKVKMVLNECKSVNVKG